MKEEITEIIVLSVRGLREIDRYSRTSANGEETARLIVRLAVLLSQVERHAREADRIFSEASPRAQAARAREQRKRKEQSHDH